MKKAFTLIELLVVIAIIAILAAILFPVFAQAKSSAKATSSLSNTKQNTLAIIMYGADYDDTFVLGTTWNAGDAPLIIGGWPVSTWTWSVMPYMKSASLFLDPLTSPNGDWVRGGVTIPKAVTDSFWSQYGYNYTFLSPTSGTPQRFSSVSMTAAAQPAGTIMIGAKYARAERITPYIWGTGFNPDEGMLSNVAIDVPDCWHIPQWCLDSWGSGSFHSNPDPAGGLGLNEQAGGFTGGISVRVASKMILGFVDGHAKRLSIGEAAAGTNFNMKDPANGGRPTQNSDIIVTDTSKYLWDLQ